MFTLFPFLFALITGSAQSYPKNYFRHPLNIPMQLVANFGEIRTNHWHMGLDIRTQQKVNLPVYAAADGYVSRVSVEPGGFGQAIYIDHPNGFTTLYAHLNSFFPELASYVKQQQYEQESWRVNLVLPPGLFPVKKSDLIARSGSTGASEGPHVHFEIRDTKTGNCLNPLLFGFPIADAVPPTLIRLALYDRNRSTYAQTAQVMGLKKSGAYYTIQNGSIRVGSNRISFAIGAIDRFSGTPNPNGIYSARILLDEEPVSEFVHDNISYDDTRYINAQLDLPYKIRTGSSLQHISPLPGANNACYKTWNKDGIIHLTDDQPHNVRIEVKDAKGNSSNIRFIVQYDGSLPTALNFVPPDSFIPGNVNIFERENFELYTTEQSIYDTVPVSFTETSTPATGSISALFNFLSNAIPVHDSINIRIKPDADLPEDLRDRVVIKNKSGSRTYVEKARWQNGWLAARFRQFGSYQAFIDNEPPVLNNPPANLTRSSRIIFTPRDNFNSIRYFRAEVDGQWLRFSNDKGKTWIYSFDEKFPKGQHELKVTVEDEAGNVTTKVWNVVR